MSGLNGLRFVGPIAIQASADKLYDSYSGTHLVLLPSLSIGVNNVYLWFGVGVEWLNLRLNVGISKKSWREPWLEAKAKYALNATTKNETITTE